MAFHGARGGSRGRGPSSGATRGRGGSRGRGGAGGRGSGGGARGGSARGRGGFRGRGKPIFDSARIAQKEAEKEEDTESQSSSEEEEEPEDIETSDDEDEEAAPTLSAYEALLQSFASETPRETKRRKLEHAPEPETIEEQEVLLENDDVVDEAEEGPETAIEGVLDEDEEDASDPFETHFADPDDNELARKLKSIQDQQWRTQKLTIPQLGNAIFRLPQSGSSEVSTSPSISGFGDLKLKQKLFNVASKQRPILDVLEQTIAPLVFNYQDVLYCERSLENQEVLRRLTCLHAVNHIFKTRDRVIKNNARLAKEDKDDDLEFKDQGFTRPKVLMILPTRESCVRMVNMITSLCEPEQQENRKRFDDSFVEKEEKFSTEKAEDFRDLFAGNDDDYFRLGLKFTRKTIKYFSQFYNSDIIFASPLGLRMAIEGENDKKGDYDFLSSIEMVVVDQADTLLMQNWDHVEHIFENLNRRPTEPHGCDFSRVRSWYLEENAKFFRQTITLAAFNTPDINSLLFNRSQNWAGRIKISATYTGVIHQHILGVRAKQTFSRFSSEAMVTDPEDRFEYFKQAIIPGLNRRTKDTAGTVIFIPSYFDFVRVRNYFIEESKLTFGSISEHSSVKDVARARSHFYSGRYSVLLYTERAHHFRRYQIRGVKKVVMYGLPENPIFYKEIVGEYLSRSVREGTLGRQEGIVKVMFSQWDRMKLERVAGTERVGKMIMEKGDTFDFI